MAENAPTDTGAAAPAEAAPVTTLATEAPATDTPVDQAAPAEGEAKTTEGDKPAEGEDTSAEGEKPAGAPEAYTDFTAPEGIEIDATVAETLKATAKELNLTQEQAQKIADLGAAQAERWAKAQQDQVVQAGEAWLGEVKADKELGGDNLKATTEAIAKSMGKFATPEFKALLNETRLGNHPEFVRFAARVGKAISEDTFVPGAKNTTPTGTLADRMYPPK